jgi:aminopeptidase N
MRYQTTLRKQAGFIQFAVGAAFAVAGALSGRKSRKAQNAARRQQQQANRLRNLQSKRQFLRNFRQQQAAAIATPLAQGVAQSSFAQATASSQRAQAGVASGEFAELSRLGEAASANLNRAATASFNASIFGSLAQFAVSPGGADLLQSLKGNGN